MRSKIEQSNPSTRIKKLPFGKPPSPIIPNSKVGATVPSHFIDSDSQTLSFPAAPFHQHVNEQNRHQKVLQDAE